MELVEIGFFVYNYVVGKNIVRILRSFLIVYVEVEIVFLNRDVFCIKFYVIFDFFWRDEYYGIFEFFYIWVENFEIVEIYYYEYFIFN